MHYLTRRFTFSASHRLHSPVLDAHANQCAFGICQNIHGHNYRLEVTVRGDVDPQTGFFCNVMDLAGEVKRLVADPCEHQFLNDLPLFQGVVTTMENIAGCIWRTLEKPLAAKGMHLVEVLVGETDEHWVRFRGEGN
jgi:6-pyruvoyltetrahydropterin/6-carboxytetrahydropterin synthase